MSSSALPRYRFDRAGRRYVGLISFSHALQHLYFTALPITYPLVVKEFGVSYATLGLVLTLSGVTSGVLQGAAGFYERIQAKSVLAMENLLTAVVAVASGTAPNFAVFGATRWAGAVITSPQHPVGASVLARRFPERRGTVLSWHTTGGAIGTLVVPLIASGLIVAVGWRWMLALFAVPLMVGAWMLWRLLPNETQSGGAESVVRSLRQTVLTRQALALIVASTVAAGGRGLGTLGAYVPVYLGNGLHLGQLTLGLVYTVLLVGSVIGPLTAGLLSDRLGRRRLIVAAYLIGAASLVVFARVHGSVYLLALVAFCVGTFVYTESPLLQSLYSDVVQGASARGAFGIYFMAAFGAGSLWLVVLGTVIDHFGFTAAFDLMAASFVVAIPLVLFAHGKPQLPAE